jgi:hypothetical protein
MSMTTARAANVHAVDRGEVDQSRFFSAGDHLRTNAGFCFDPGEKLSAVACFARGARGGSENFVDGVRFGKPLEFGKRLERGAHRVGRELLAVESAGAEPDHRFLAIDDLERQVRPDADHDHVDGVGADVYGRNAHASVSRIRGLIVPESASRHE